MTGRTDFGKDNRKTRSRGGQYDVISRHHKLFGWECIVTRNGKYIYGTQYVATEAESVALAHKWIEMKGD